MIATVNRNKEDLSVDNVDPSFGLTKHRSATSPHTRNEPKLASLTKDREVMSCSAPLPMKSCRPTPTYPTHQERDA